MKKIINLKDKIYFLTFGNPRYKMEISNLIYGKEVKQIYPEINKLEQDRWIKKIDYDYEPDELAGKRAKRRKYYQANVEPLLHNICEELNTIALINKDKTLRITQEEKTKLKSFFKKESFRTFIRSITNIVNLYNETDPFSLIKSNIGIHCLYLHSVNVHYSNAFGGNEDYLAIARRIFNLVYDKYFKSSSEDVIEINPDDMAKYESMVLNANFFQLGKLLIKKLANLTRDNPNLLAVYFDSLIITGEEIVMKQKNK